MIRSTTPLLLATVLGLCCHCSVDERTLETPGSRDVIIDHGEADAGAAALGAGGSPDAAGEPSGGSPPADEGTAEGTAGATSAPSAEGGMHAGGAAADEPDRNDEPENPVANPGFAADVSAWTATPSVALAWSNNDAAGNVASGSARLTPADDEEADGVSVIRQCIELAGTAALSSSAGSVLELEAKAYIAPDLHGQRAALNAYLYEAEGCAGERSGDSFAGEEAVEAGRWLQLHERLAGPSTAAATAHSLLLELEVRADAAFDVRFDDVRVRESLVEAPEAAP